MNDIVISVRNVSKCYHVFDNQRSRLLHAIWPKRKVGVEEIWALKDINFEIRQGESVAIIGRNGGGKSTLLEILTGILTPSTGDVVVTGRVSALLELGSGFNPEYSGRDNVIMNGLLLGLSRAEIMDRFDEIEAFAEIGTAIHRQVKTYSSGMMMRLAFAVQVLCDPDILIIDEALSVGDFFFQQKCLSYIRDLRERGTTLLFVSHDMGTVRDICNRGVLLEGGKLNFCGDMLEAINRYLAINIEESGQNNSYNELVHSEKTTVSTNARFELKRPMWTHNGLDKQKTAQILGVCFLDSNGDPFTSVQIGSEITIQTLFISSNLNPVHVSVTLKNKYDQVVTTVSSYTLKTPMLHSTDGHEILFEMKIVLAVEAGNYVFAINLGQIEAVGRGTVLDETPWLGPFQVLWDYHKEIPSFYGLVGLPATAKFLSQISA